MSIPGGGDISELLRRLGDDALIHEAESHGLSPRAGRMRCPWAGCEHKGAERERDAVVFAAKHPRVYCYACGTTGDLVDLLQRTRNLSPAEALAHVQGQKAPERPRPELRVVPGVIDEAGKLPVAEVKRLWEALSTASDAGRAYLEGRGLDGAVDAGLVRFTSEDSKSKEIVGYACRGYRVAALLSDVVGNPRGIQMRLTREPHAKEPKILSVKGSVTSRAFFGEPGLIESAPIVAVAEGMADTLALQQWADGHIVVVGAAGKGFVPRLAEELEAAGIGLEGKLFALFPQNDRPENLSRREFQRLSQLLSARGARVCWVTTPDECADLADWRKSQPGVEWPPAELVKAFGNTPGDDSEPTTVLPDGVALPIPLQVRTERYAQNFTTLMALLDDPSSREAILRTREELTWCEMTTGAMVGGRGIVERDISSIRLGLEAFARSTDGKPLQFGERDIEKALDLVASRKSIHRIRAWLRGLPSWDGTPRLEVELPQLLGHAPGSFEARLLRRWFVSLIARPMKPGCQVDTVLILTGGQGAKKTSFFRTLGGEWTTSSKVEPGDRDGMLVMRQFWIVEWGELSSMRARTRDATKDFITNPVDTFRKPYGRDSASAPRHCVIVGTTNDKEILEDPTGNRRYWPIEVLTQKIDVKRLSQLREQLFAEALALYDVGFGCPDCRGDQDGRCSEHRWWLTDEEEAQLAERNREFDAVDAWQAPIARWLSEQLPMEVTTEQVLAHALMVPVEHHTNQVQQRVGQVLRQVGWERGKARRNGTVVNVYRPPENRHEQQ